MKDGRGSNTTMDETAKDLTMRVSAATTIPAKLASAVVRNLAKDTTRTINVSAIGPVACRVASEALGIAQRYAEKDNLTLSITEGDQELTVEDRALGAQKGDTKIVTGHIFTVIVLESLPAIELKV